MAGSRHLQRLVDARRFDDLLREVTLGDIARAWVRYQHKLIGPTMTPDDDPEWWAVEAWTEDEWWADESRVRSGILELVAAADTELDFGALGAAIMEHFVADDDDRLVWLEQHAGTSENFVGRWRTCMCGAYNATRLPQGLKRRQACAYRDRATGPVRSNASRGDPGDGASGVVYGSLGAIGAVS